VIVLVYNIAFFFSFSFVLSLNASALNNKLTKKEINYAKSSSTTQKKKTKKPKEILYASHKRDSGLSNQLINQIKHAK